MRIGQVSFRLAGSDGVSLETAKQTQILERRGYTSYYFAGELDPPDQPEEIIRASIQGAMLVPEAHFTHPEAMWITKHAFGSQEKHPEFDQRLQAFASVIESALHEFIDRYHIEVLFLQNILAIPMNLALSLAVYRVIKTTGIPAVAHHHDFYWERDYYLTNCVDELLEEVFPPDLPNLRHMVINSMAQKKLTSLGFNSIVLPNVLDFEQAPPGIDDFNNDLRSEIGLDQSDLLFLQPTRVIPRKGIELSIELIQKLALPQIKLVVTHHIEYNSLDYFEEICAAAARARVPLYYLPARFEPIRRPGSGLKKVFSLWDAYIHADFVMYPSLYEGFGNALIEAVFFRKPLLVNRYQVFKDDIEPTGLKAIKINGTITGETISQVQDLLGNPKEIEQITSENLRIAKEHFSYQVASTRLEQVLKSL